MKYLITILSMIWMSSTGFTQVGPELMNNGGFEVYDNSVTVSPSWLIDYAQNWHKLINSPDLFHPSTIINPVGGAQYSPRTGEGHANFIFPHYGVGEYFYGSTLPLTAGVIYNVSFWVKGFNNSAPQTQVGLKISSSVPTPIQIDPYVASVIPNVTAIPSTGQYERVTYCFTPTISGVHYLTFGFFQEVPSDQNQIHYFALDDVSVKESGNIFSEVNLSMPNTVVCVENTVIIEGSSSLNEIEYEWDVYNITSGSEVLVSNGNIQVGQAGQLNVTTLFSSVGHTPQKGNCYRVYLTTYNGCPNKEFIEFCYENPNINFLNNTNYLCEGVPTDLTVTGDDGWTYTWSTGDSGTGSDGFKTVQVTPSGTTVTYSVNVLTNNGCTASTSHTFNVFSSNNLAPWMNGVNGSGEYTVYVNQGDIVNFTSNLFNDNANESVENFQSSTIPTFYTLSIPQNTGTVSFHWNTGQGFAPNVAPGVYQFVITSNDHNNCNIGYSNFTFTIVVVCDQCPICLDYENRTPSTTPLPEETKVGKCIQAGLAQTVETGNANVLFQAGVYIELGPFFEAGPGFEGVIEPTTCITDCEDCCTDWNGFTLDEIPNGYYMNFEDSDPTNDIFQITDVYHPFCAFSAKGYELSILNQLGNVMAESSFSSSLCCPFDSPAPENQIPHSSIWWDGYTDNIFGNQVHPDDGIYYYYLKLFGCDGEEEEYHGFIQIFSTSGLIVAPTDPNAVNDEQRDAMTASIDAMNKFTTEISLSPNPSDNVVQIIGIEQGKTFKAQLFDDKGLMIDRDLQLKNGQFDVSKLSPGSYFCKILIDGTSVTKKFVKI